MFTRKKNLGDQLKELFGRGQAVDAHVEDLEDALLEADVGPAMAVQLVDELRTLARSQKLSNAEAIRAALATLIADRVRATSLDLTGPGPHCFLFLGVNGVGKTTSIAKLAKHFRSIRPDLKIVLAAGDTFRAAASEQLELHGNRLGLRTVRQDAGSDSAAVIFDALTSAKSRGEDLVLADTAGRLHNKSHLVMELEKIDKIVRSKVEAGAYKKILVLDATTGRNGVQQAEVFNQAVGVDAVIVTKYDSNAKGGMVLSIGAELGLGVAFLGHGEAYDDLKPFNPAEFAQHMVGLS